MDRLPYMIASAARSNPHKVAIIEGERKLTYLGLQEKVRSIAGHLGGMGVKPGDSVALLLPNGADFVASFLAVAQAGAVAVPLNTQYRQNELTYFLSDCDASTLITVREFEHQSREILGCSTRRCDLFVLDETAAWQARQEFPCGAQGAIDMPNGNAGENLIYQYTSGSTGRPKRIARTHSNLIFEVKSLAKTLNLNSEDKFLGVVPFSHVNGLMRSMLACLSVGATLFPVREFKRQMIARTIDREQITVFIGVPFIFSILGETNFRERVDFSSLRLCVSASAPMAVAANRRFREKYGFYVRQLYGSTETGTISVNLSEDIENSLESVGTPIDGVEIRVFRDDGDPAAIDEVGEVAVKSQAAISRYDNIAETDCFRDGYFFTGDLGKVNRTSQLYLVGRKKFFINKGGYKINPWEVETFLNGHPKVKEVVVVGFPTSYGDEAVKAVIVPNRSCSEEEIVEYCRGKIADFKIPSFIEFRQDLPKSATGKVLRKNL